MERIVSVTKKGQATIPKVIRDRYGIKDKVVIVEDERGIVLKPLPAPGEDFGSLKHLFKGKDAKTILAEARRQELRKEKNLMRNAKT